MIGSASPRRTRVLLLGVVVLQYYILCRLVILGRAPCMKGTLSVFVKIWISVNGTYSVVSGYTISISFHRLMDDQRTPGFWGVTQSAHGGRTAHRYWTALLQVYNAPLMPRGSDDLGNNKSSYVLHSIDTALLLSMYI